MRDDFSWALSQCCFDGAEGGIGLMDRDVAPNNRTRMRQVLIYDAFRFGVEFFPMFYKERFSV